VNARRLQPKLAILATRSNRRLANELSFRAPVARRAAMFPELPAVTGWVDHHPPQAGAQ
jgi:hypothetical protein